MREIASWTDLVAPLLGMATAKTARSRGAPVKENGVKLEEGLGVFKSDRFDADAYVQSKCSLNEKVPLWPI